MHQLVSYSLATVRGCELFIMPEIYSATTHTFMIGDVLVSRLSFEDWLIIERSQFSDDLTDVYARKVPPFFCIFPDPGVGGVYDDHHDFIERRHGWKVQMLSTALSIAIEACVPNPLNYVSYYRRGSTNQRRMSYFGHSAYWPTKRIEVDEELIARWTLVYSTLQIFNNFRNCPRLGLAVALYFDSASSYASAEWTRELLLHAAIEALLGTFISRLSEVKWNDPAITTAIQKRKQRRNALAHGTASADAEYSATLRRMTSRLLVESLRQELVFPSREESSSKSLDANLIDALKSARAFGPERLKDLPVDSNELLYGVFRKRS
jgi:hypothetical protein